jgi:hypothetical protein
VVSLSVGAIDRLGNFTQYFSWISRNLVNIHVDGVAAVCWAFWKLRNMACFQKKLIRSPTEIIFYMLVLFYIGLVCKRKKNKEIRG